MSTDAQRDGRPAICSVPAHGEGQASCKVWLASGVGCRCSNETKMRKPLKFAGVPQTTKPISAVSGPKFTILWETCGEDSAV